MLGLHFVFVSMSKSPRMENCLIFKYLQPELGGEEC